MEILGDRKLWSFFDHSKQPKLVENISAIRAGQGHRVKDFLELATKVAELQFRNREHVLMFRGQGSDHRNQSNNTSLKPTILRPERGQSSPPDPDALIRRFNELKRAVQRLVYFYNQSPFLGKNRVVRERIVRWSILQHYEICGTPLLDVSHSLRVSASFATHWAEGDAYLFVLAVPNLSGALTASADAGVQIVRLSSMCPPSAVRPHIQEGYLLGEYPEMPDFDQKQLYPHYEIDFGRRLLAKFRFDPKTFWKGGTFPKVAKSALYPPTAKDPFFRLATALKKDLATA